MANPVERKKRNMKPLRSEWGTYWKMYDMGLVSLTSIKNLMRERYFIKTRI